MKTCISIHFSKRLCKSVVQSVKFTRGLTLAVRCVLFEYKGKETSISCRLHFKFSVSSFKCIFKTIKLHLGDNFTQNWVLSKSSVLW